MTHKRCELKRCECSENEDANQRVIDTSKQRNGWFLRNDSCCSCVRSNYPAATRKCDVLRGPYVLGVW